jgi:DNA-binding GntR family transcriptional regulator
MHMTYERIAAPTIRQQVYDRLKEKICSAAISPGNIITLRELAREFGVSMMPVREALWQLQSEKIILIESNRNMHVNKLCGEEMKEIISLRLILESKALDRVCKSNPPDMLLEMKSILDVMRQHIKKREIPEYLVENRKFHFSIYSRANSPISLQIIESLWARTAPYFSIVLKERKELSLSMENHMGIYRSLVEINSAAAKEFLKRDLKGASKALEFFI